MREILAGSRERYELEFRVVRRDGAVRSVMDRGQAIKDPATGRVVRVVGILLDITHLKAAEERQRLLINELNHRVKNTLAIVQSIAMHTLRTKAEPKDFAEAFSARLASLASAHNLLTRGAWRGAPLGDIVQSTLAPFRTGRGAIEISGDPITIPANATITLSLMLHELATNASKYGALSSPQGRIVVSWRVTETADETVIDLHWAERDGPPVRTPPSKGFGTRLLEASALQMACELSLDYHPEGLRCRITFALRSDQASHAAD